MAAAALLLIVAWVSITLVQSGGLPQLIRGVGASQPAVADEVPMRAPEGWRPGAASQAAARSAGQTGARVTSQPVVRPIPASRSGAFPNLDRP